MDILIRCCDNNKEEVIKDVIYRINLSADKALDWNVERVGEAIYCKSDCNSQIGMVIKSFDKLLELYPALDINASYSYQVREEDGSAYWFETETIETVHNADGTAYIKRNTSTNWY